MYKPIKCNLCDNGFYKGYWCVRCYSKALLILPSLHKCLENTTDPTSEEIAKVAALRLTGAEKAYIGKSITV